MKKYIFLFIACLVLMPSTLQAQFSAAPYVEGNRIQKAPASDAAELFPWGYCDDEITNGVGVGGVAKLSAAIAVKHEKIGAHAGRQLKAIHVGLSAASTGLSIFIMDSLSGTVLYEQAAGVGLEGWNEITLTEPFTIPESDFFVGYTCTGLAQIGFSGRSYEDGCWLWYEGWDNYVQQGWGSVCIQLLIDASQPKMDIGFEEVYSAFCQMGKSFNISGTLRNNSTVEARNFKASYQIGEGAVQENTAEINIAPGSIGNFSFEAAAVDEIGEMIVKMTITEVNGAADEFALNNEANVSFTSHKYIYPRKVVVEEGTGTWCGWCPRGIVGLEKMIKKYPDSFIGIAVHTGDQMTTSTYNAIHSGFFSAGYPNSVTNRKKANIGDPAFENLEDIYNKEMNIAALVGVAVDAVYADEEGKAISVASDVTFGFNSSSANYRIAYVLIEHKVEGYKQTNNYAGGARGEMGGFESLPSSASIEFNDVARSIYQYTGLVNSIPATVEENVTVTHNYTINMPSSIKKKDEVEVVAMLIDGRTGEIVNADKVKVREFDVSMNIGQVSTTSQFAVKPFVENSQLAIEIQGEGMYTVEVYSVDGQKIAAQSIVVDSKGILSIPATGLSGTYIIKVNDGEEVVTDKITL